MTPVAYYSIAITKTHYFILYAFYHADDDNHPNDLEGCLLIIKKNDIRPQLIGMITVSHYDFVPYFFDNRTKIKQALFWQSEMKGLYETEKNGDNVLIQQTNGKHALYGLSGDLSLLDYLKRKLKTTSSDLGTVVYYPSTKAERYDLSYLKQFGETPHYPTQYYELVDILDSQNGLFDRYLDAKRHGGNHTFTEEGSFHNSENPHILANGPWVWEPKEIFDTIDKGAMWKDPAKLALTIFDLDENNFSTSYDKTMDMH